MTHIQNWNPQPPTQRTLPDSLPPQLRQLYPIRYPHQDVWSQLIDLHPKYNASRNLGCPSKVRPNGTCFLPHSLLLPWPKQSQFLQQTRVKASWAIPLLSPVGSSSLAETRVMVLKGKSQHFILHSKHFTDSSFSSFSHPLYMHSAIPLAPPTVQALLKSLPLPGLFLFDIYTANSPFSFKVYLLHKGHPHHSK